MYIQLPLLLIGSWKTRISSTRLSERNYSVLLENRRLLGSEWFGHGKGFCTRISLQKFAFIEEIEIWAIEKYARLRCLCLVISANGANNNNALRRTDSKTTY